MPKASHACTDADARGPGRDRGPDKRPRGSKRGLTDGRQPYTEEASRGRVGEPCRPGWARRCKQGPVSTCATGLCWP
eukprot:14392718-Alexandrium_andersonii.AAC.1